MTRRARRPALTDRTVTALTTPALLTLLIGLSPPGAAGAQSGGDAAEKLPAPDQPEDPRNRRMEIRDIGRPSP